MIINQKITKTVEKQPRTVFSILVILRISTNNRRYSIYFIFNFFITNKNTYENRDEYLFIFL